MNQSVGREELYDKPMSTDMIPSIAVVNVLSIWAMADPEGCYKAMGADGSNNGLVLKATIHPGATNDAFEFHITLPDNSIDICDLMTLSGIKSGIKNECCVERGSNPIREKYWVLNPGAIGNERLVVPTDRRDIETFVNQINHHCQNKQNVSIYGLEIRLK